MTHDTVPLFIDDFICRNFISTGFRIEAHVAEISRRQMIAPRGKDSFVRLEIPNGLNKACRA